MLKPVLLLLPLFASSLMAQTGKRIFLPDNDSFSPYFSSAITAKKVPVIVTTDPALADYTIRFHQNDSNGNLIQGITSAINGSYNSGAFNEVALTVIDNKTKDVVYSYTCKKYNQYSGDDSRMATSVAECLAKHWKGSIKN